MTIIFDAIVAMLSYFLGSGLLDMLRGLLAIT